MSLHNSQALLHTISYPPKVRKQPYCPPLSSALSRRLLAEFRKVSRTGSVENRKFTLTIDKSKHDVTPESLFQDAKKSMASEDWDTALDIIKELIAGGLSTPEIFIMAGESYQNKDLPERAIDMYTKSLGTDPLTFALYNARGDCYLMMEQHDKAADEFEKYMKMVEPHYDVIVKAGRACLDCDRFERSAELLQMAQKMKPDDAYVLYNFGELYEKMGNNTLAAQYFGSVSKVDPEFTKAYVQQAEGEEAKGNLELALELYQSILKVESTNASLYMKCAMLYIKLGEEFATNAIACLTKGIELANEPQSEETRTLLEDMLLEKGQLLFRHFHDLEASIADFTLCISLNPKNIDALESRALCFRQRNVPGDLTHAAGDYEVFVSIPEVEEDRRGVAHAFLAEYYFEQRDYKSAAKHYNAAWLCGADHTFDIERLSLAFSTVYLAELAASMPPPVPPETTPRPPETARAKTARAGAAAHDPPVDPNQPVPLHRQLPSLRHVVFDQYYVTIKSLDPTAHTELFYEYYDSWGKFRTDLEKQREEELLGAKGKKGGPAKKK